MHFSTAFSSDIASSESVTLTPGLDPVELAEPVNTFAPESLARAYGGILQDDEQQLVQLEAGDANELPLHLTASRPTHLLTQPYNNEKGLDAVEFNVNIDGPEDGFDFNVVVHDPLAPEVDLMWIDLHGEGPGQYSFTLDFPDQVMFKDSRLWLSLSFDSDVTMSGPDGGAPEIILHHLTREDALTEALSYRKFLLKTMFALLSECRPWGAYRDMTRDEFFSLNKYAALCPELFLAIDLCHELDPTDDMVRQYREWVYLRNLDELSDVEFSSSPPEGVPDWAWYPRMTWLETRDMLEWWLDNRAVPTGELGGKVSDDSDMYQQFSDFPFLADDDLTAKLLDNAMRLAELTDKKHIRDGINILLCDALHAYEEGINHMALMSRWFYGDPIYLERNMVSARNMEKMTIVTSDGRRHIRDKTMLGHADIATPREPGVDGHATTLMWHTALQTADYNRNPAALKLVSEWTDTWLKYQKPGQWVTGIDIMSGKVTASDKNRPLAGGYRSQALANVWLYKLTGERKYLEPFEYFYRKGEAPSPASVFAAELYTLGYFDGQKELPLDKIAEHSPVLKLYLTGDPSELIKRAIGTAEAGNAQISNLYDARRWPMMYTTAEQFNDRVFPDISMSGSVSALGGYSRRNKFVPTQGLSWEGFSKDYGALVLKNKRDGLKTLAYSYSDVEIEGGIRVWALEHGRYKLTVGPDSDGDKKMDSIVRTEILELAKADRIQLTLPPKAVTVIEIEQIEKLDPIFTRADLAIAAREVKLTETELTGTVHNIGADDSGDFVIAVTDASGAVQAEIPVDSIEAPLDLFPRSLDFKLTLSQKAGPGWKLVIDHEDRVSEIYEGNNTVEFGALPAVDYREGF